MRKNTDLVLQLHLHPSGKEETDRSRSRLLADKPVSADGRRVGGGLADDRHSSRARYTITSSVTLPIDVTLISLLPHMHLVGKEMKLTATLPDGIVKSLIWIRDWNFFWQNNYILSRAAAPAGRHAVGHREPVRQLGRKPAQSQQAARVRAVRQRQHDEMCFGILQVVADRPSDEQKIGMALMQSAFKQWNESPIDAEGRQHILDEAGKLFGTDAKTLNSFLKAGSRVATRFQRKQPRPAGE